MQNNETQSYDPVDPSVVDKLREAGEKILEVGQTVDVDGVPHVVRRIDEKDIVLRPAHWDQLDRFDDLDVHESKAIADHPAGLEAGQQMTVYVRRAERFRIHNIIFKADKITRRGFFLRPEGNCTVIEGSPV